ncbi:cytoplasmic FMR1-interacting protein-like [Glossina fuscipes fuscipes]
MIVLLGQQRRFKALDFWCHILRVQRVDGKNEDVKGIVNPTRLTKLKRMLDPVRRFEVLNSQIFAILKGSDVERSKVEHLRCYPSPPSIISSHSRSK